MKKTNRIIIVGHPGAGKAVLGNAIAEKLGWNFVDADYGIEVRTGALVNEILGEAGTRSLRAMEKRILTQQPDQSVIVTDVGIVLSEENRAYLKNEYVVFVTLSFAVQLERMSRHVNSLLNNTDREKLLADLHERDVWFNDIANITINTDNGDLHTHVNAVLKDADLTPTVSMSNKVKLENSDMVLYHYQTHQPVQLTEQQAICLKLLAQGKSAKEIGITLDISYRTVEGHLSKTMELLGCGSSKELISLYLGRL